MPVRLNGCGSVSRTVRVESRVKSCLSSIVLMRLRSAAIGPLDVLAFTAVTTGGHAARHCISVLSAHVSPSFGNPRGRIVRSTVFSLVIFATEFPISALAALGYVALGSLLAPPRCTNLPVSSSSSDLPAATPRCVPLSFDGLEICPACLAPPCSCSAFRARERAPAMFQQKVVFLVGST